MDRDQLAPDQAATDTEAAHWICRNCGSFNPPGNTHCDSCGFVQGYDPDAVQPVQRGTLPAMFVPRDEIPGRVTFYMNLLQLLAVLAIAALAIPLLLRLSANWPFQSPYERDAMQLATRLMSMSASVQLGISKADYDAQLGPLLGENLRFQGMYDQRPERQRDSYQKLVLAAEFYSLAGQTWSADMQERRMPAPLVAAAQSGDAEEEVKDYFQRAAASARSALGDLH